MYHYRAEYLFLKSFRGLTIPHYCIFGATGEGVARMAKDRFESEPWVFAIEKTKHCPMVEDHACFCSVLAGIMAK